MFDYKCVWSALYPISNHSHIRQLQFATHAFSQQVLQQAVQISICQWVYFMQPDSIFTLACEQVLHFWVRKRLPIKTFIRQISHVKDIAMQ